MNAYLAEVLKKREEAAKKIRTRNIAWNLLKVGKFTLEEIAQLTGLDLAEVTRIERAREGLSE